MEATYKSDHGFYQEIAQRIGKQRLESHEADKAFRVRFTAVLNYEANGRTNSPTNDPLEKAAWEVAQDVMARGTC